ncbi:MauE/DoxX family redox-associated membrane protein [Streptomyces sp. PT12]|uniref:MauE/DoxX family redox-associated membrane protein n=1 Tax=Streptomyces sp. PT12 TaxID=1510197 RepID=UPI000DE4E038|nr:MauE/DoxX family redox-associated membrane protein [Streptomyces sp. PT12]RBM20675.1 hypothetical protein DEH69_06800 [Streptomyces sp. PT12]
MFSLIATVSPLLIAGLLGWSGLAKLRSRSLLAQAGRTALPRLVRGPRRAARVLRASGAAEVAVAAALLAAPEATVPAVGTVLMGVAFLGYLGAAKAVAPESSCGCTANDTQPVTWRAFARAGLVAGGGAAALGADGPWWSALADGPLPALALLAAGAAALVYLSEGPVVFRRLRLRLLGNPLARGARSGEPQGAPHRVPVAASVELLERSLAWETVSPLIRSGLVEHWDADGWRFLHYTGARGAEGGDRPVSVLFAMDATAHRDRPAGQAIRVSVVDQETEEVLPVTA